MPFAFDGKKGKGLVMMEMIPIKDGRQRMKRKERKEGEEKGKKREGEDVQRTAVFFSQIPGKE